MPSRHVTSRQLEDHGQRGFSRQTVFCLNGSLAQGEAVTDDIDVYRAAALMMKQRGEDAPIPQFGETMSASLARALASG